MKKFLSLFVMFLLCQYSTRVLADNQMYMTGPNASPGQTVELNLNLNNSDPVAAWACTLYFPEGIVFNQLSVNTGRYPEEPEAHTLPTTDGGILFAVVYSEESHINILTGTDGAIATISISVPDDFTPGDYNIEIKKISLSSNDGVSFPVNESSTFAWKVVESGSDIVYIPAAGYATYVATKDVDFTNSGVEAFSVKESTKEGYGYIHLNPVTAAPEGEAVVLKGEEGAYVISTAVTKPAALEGNLLKAAKDDFTADGSQYCLADGSDGVGFYQVQTGTTIAAGRGYLEMNGAGTKVILFDSNATDADVIEFADVKVKAICVANWDTDTDGELSRTEAAAVTDLGEVFKGNTDITSFDELQYFTGLTSIGNGAFHSCSGLTSITIGNSVTSIGSQAFIDCSGLTSVTIGNGVTSIGYDAFWGCSSLISIIIPNSVTSIGSSAFVNCSSLTSVTIPNSVTSIGGNVFSWCSGLTSIIVEEGNTVYDSRGNCNAIIETGSNTLISGCMNTIIPNNVTNIGSSAFCGCSNLTSITIPESVTSIGDHAFWDCSDLTSVTIPNSVTIIGEMAFSICSSLTSVIIGNSVTSIGSQAFDRCISLTSVTIPSSVTNIGSNPFIVCIGLTSIIVEEGNVVYDSRGNCNAIIETGSNTLISGCMNTIIPNNVTSIGDHAFFGCSGLTSVTIPGSVTSIGDAAFYDCAALTEIISYIEEPFVIDDNVYDGTTYETATLRVPAGTSDAYRATDGWKNFVNIEEMEVSGSTLIEFADAKVKAICVANWDTDGDGELNREEAAAVTDLGAIFKDNDEITSFDELQYFTGLTSIGYEAFRDCGRLTSVTIPNSVTSIGGGAFWSCSSLTSVTIPNSVTFISAMAFAYCSGLTSVTIPESVTGIGIGAFEANRLTSIVVESGNTRYDSRNNCNAIIETASNTLIAGCMNTIIPNNVTSIGDNAFAYCSGLTSITIPNSVTSIGSNAFSGCSGLTSITIPNSVTRIGDYAFSGCSGLTSIIVEEGNTVYDSRGNCNAIIETGSNTLIRGCMNTIIPNSVTSIGNYAFFYCIYLTSVSIPNSVTSIGGYAFLVCRGLTSVTIPNSVTSIGDEAFFACSDLTEIISYIEDPFVLTDNVYDGTTYETAILRVPAGTSDAYRATDGWKNFVNIEEMEEMAHQLTIAVVGDGSVIFSDETLADTTATFVVNGEVQLQFVPQGGELERVMVNQEDRTSDVADGVLTLNVIEEDCFVLAEFQHNETIVPDSVTYTIYIDGPGDVRVEDKIFTGSEQTVRVPKGGDLVLEFMPDEGQMVGKATWNGETVTEQAMGNTFVVRDVQADGTVSVIFMERMETFVYAGIKYGIIDDVQHTLKVLPYDYSGHLFIPEGFDYSQRTWQVQDIGNLAFANSEWLVSVQVPASVVQTGKNLFKRDTRLAAIQWDAELPLRTDVTGELTNANMLYYVKDRTFVPQGGNVIVDGMADNISLSDGHDFYCPEAFRTKKIAYSHIYKMLTRRGYRQGWETLVLPFDVETIRLTRNPDNPEIYPYESLTDDAQVESGETLPFWLYNYNDNDTFTPASAIEANTPYIISMPNDAVYLPIFCLAGSVTFSAQAEAGVEVQSTKDDDLQTPGTRRSFHPSYQRQVMGNDCYLVNVNDSVNHQFAEGSKFVQALRPSRPFEAYMVSQTSTVKPWYDIFDQMFTDIKDIRAGEGESSDGSIYDLGGRKISSSQLSSRRIPQGIYIVDRKKKMIK